MNANEIKNMLGNDALKPTVEKLVEALASVRAIDDETRLLNEDLTKVGLPTLVSPVRGLGRKIKDMILAAQKVKADAQAREAAAELALLERQLQTPEARAAELRQKVKTVVQNDESY